MKILTAEQQRILQQPPMPMPRPGVFDIFRVNDLMLHVFEGTSDWDWSRRCCIGFVLAGSHGFRWNIAGRNPIGRSPWQPFAVTAASAQQVTVIEGQRQGSGDAQG